MNWAVVISVLACVALSAVRPRPVFGGVWAALILWIGMLAAAAVGLSQLPLLPFYPGNDALRRTAREAARLAAVPLRQGDVVIVIEGSSAVTCDVNGAELERLLRERGLPARVMQVSAGGSNHFERIAMLREWRAGLNPGQAKALRKCRVVVLGEVLRLYDEVPLHGLAENAFSERSIAGATPGNLAPMLRVAWTKSRADAGASAGLLPVIVEHGFFNAFRVGTFPLFRAAPATYSANGDPAGAGRGANDPGARRRLLDGMPLPHPWWREIDAARRDALAGVGDEFGYLAPPVRNEREPIYQRRFLAAMPARSLQIDGGQALPRLGPALWIDKVHLNPRGAGVFTAWLAERIAADWPRFAGERR